MKHDLKNATFIMPLRIESEDRLRNIVISLAYLLKNFDTNVIIKRWILIQSFRTMLLLN